MAVRRLKAWISKSSERERLKAVGQVIDAARERLEIRRERILCNFPPAWVHHLRVDPESAEVFRRS
jgi:hypothetical protein